MHTELLIVLLLLAIGIVVVLAIVAWRLTQQVRQQQTLMQQQRDTQQAKRQAQRADIQVSLNLIAANVLDEGLNLSEATLRSKILLDALELTHDQRQPYELLDQVYQHLQHFATHKARQALSSTERFKQDLERERIEQEHQQALIACFSQLRHFQIPK